MYKSAVLSDDEKYRYQLERSWATDPWRHPNQNQWAVQLAMPGAPLVFVMLNPSTADADIDDPTIRKCMGFARRHGFYAIRVVNLFAFRATDPKELCPISWPFVGPENDGWIIDSVRGQIVVAAWGAQARRFPDRVLEVLDILDTRAKAVYCLKKLVDGTPAHPLMLPYSSRLECFLTRVDWRNCDLDTD